MVRRVNLTDSRTGVPRKRWMAEVCRRLPDGRLFRTRRFANTRAAALEREREAERDFALASNAASERELNGTLDCPTLREFVPDFLAFQAAEGNSPGEGASKESILRNHLLPCFGDQRLDEITVRQIDQYRISKLTEGKRPLSRKTINNHLAILRRVYTVAQRWNLVTHIPFIRLLTKRELRDSPADFLTFDQATAFLAAMKRLYPDHWLFVFTALRTGMRLGELRALRWQEVDLERRQILVSRNFCRDAYVAETALETVPDEPGVRMPKWGSMRSVPLPSDAHTALLAESEASSHRLVFPSLPMNKPLIGGFRSAHSIRWALTRCCRRAGLKPTHMHMLRHTYASHLVMMGVNIKAVQELLGHASLEMTMRYSHLAPDHKAGLVECLAE